jgi:acetyltransferase-like isoleucine patch superfamily enzyme
VRENIPGYVASTTNLDLAGDELTSLPDGSLPETPPASKRPLALLAFLIRNRMITPKYSLLLARLLRRRFLTVTGYRMRLAGMAFVGRGVRIQIGKRGRLRLGRWIWIGRGTKIRCHEGEVVIGDKTVLGEDCTISAYQHVSIGEQCIVADRVMLIDFDHNVAEVERPVRVQGIYKRDVHVGNNVWIGYGAQILRGVTVGDNSIIGASAVVNKDVPANAVVGGVPARIIRMREAPRHLNWRRPVEPPGEDDSGED